MFLKRERPIKLWNRKRQLELRYYFKYSIEHKTLQLCIVQCAPTYLIKNYVLLQCRLSIPQFYGSNCRTKIPGRS